MVRYVVTVELNGLRKESIEKILEPLKAKGAMLLIEKKERPESRSDRLNAVLGSLDSALEDAKSEVESLKDEIEEWKNGMEGTNLENTSKYEELSECYDALEELLSELENIEIPDAGDVSFPGMY